MTTQLVRGQNMPLGLGTVRVECTWAPQPGLDADLSALLLTGGKVPDDRAFVFYNQPSDPSSQVLHLGKSVDADGAVTDQISVSPGGLAADVESVALCVSLDGPAGSRLAQLAPLRVRVLDPLEQVVAEHALTALTSETAVQVLEIYRREQTWKLRAVGQGYDDGLAGLARDFGVHVEDPVPSPPAPRGIDWTNPPVPAGYEL
jgi:stress response protein SCP2